VGARVALAGLLTLVVFASCLKTVALIDSEPSGTAAVYFDGKKVSETTPTEIEVDWYGPHTVTFVREGHPPSKHVADVKCPVYLWIPLDFFATIMPFRITDRHEFRFALEESQTEEE